MRPAKRMRSGPRVGWLDMLPTELCVGIAAHLSGGDPTRSALALAESSPKQRSAVMSALSNKLCMHSTSDRIHNPVRWAELCREGVKEVDLTDVDVTVSDANDVILDRQHHNKPFVVALLKASSLRTAAMFDEPMLLRAVSRSSSVRDLTVIVFDRPSHETLFKALAALSLVKLKLVCSLTENCDDFCYRVCPFNERWAGHLGRAGDDCFVESCARLSSLEVNCLCGNSRRLVSSVVPRLTNLREVAFSAGAMAEAIPPLSSLDAVRFRHAYGPGFLPIALQLGPAVKELNITTCLGKEEVTMLASSPELEVLDCAIREGAESALPGVVRFLTSLRALHVNWPEIGRYSTMPYGVILGTVKAADNLRSLHLEAVRIELDEVVAVMEAMGSRLEDLQVPAKGQDEPAWDRMEALMLAATAHNPGLRRLVLEGTELPGQYASRAGRRSRGRRMLSMLRRLQRRAPYLNVSELEAFIDAYTPREVRWRGR